MSRRVQTTLAILTSAAALAACSSGSSGAEVAAPSPSVSAPTPGSVTAKGVPAPKIAPEPDGTPAPRATGPAKGSQKAVLDSLPGRARPGKHCVPVGNLGDIRSGRLAVGNFANAKAMYNQQSSGGKAEVPLYVIPARTSASRAVVRLVPVDGSGPARKVSTSAKQKADSWTYFAVQVPVPADGDYRLTASAGGVTACFQVTFGS